MNRRKIGTIGEDAVCAYLTARGYRIVERNFTIRGGEVDIIAENGTYLAFVEVKSRKPNSLVDGFSSVTERKRGFIIRTAAAYLYQHPTQLQPRFDIAAVTLEQGVALEVDYLENAFDTTGYNVIF